jgi:serine/threonine protein kinase
LWKIIAILYGGKKILDTYTTKSIFLDLVTDIQESNPSEFLAQLGCAMSLASDQRTAAESETQKAASNNDNDSNSCIRGLVRLARENITDDVLVHRIVKLDLSGQGLSSLPHGMDRALPNLSILFLSQNSFVQMPAIIGSLPSLQMVALKSNGLTSIHPNALQSQLRWLILTDNQLTEIPDTIGRCTILQKCMLSGNLLAELPSSVDQLPQLELIRLACNRLTGAPTALLQLPALKWIALGDNPFSDRTITDSEDDTATRTNSIPQITDLDLEAVACGRVLGMGASGTTVAVDYQGQTVAVKRYHTSESNHVTSDGLPASERAIALLASSSSSSSHSLPAALIRVLGECSTTQSLVMEYLDNFVALAQPPSFETCSRDVYATNDDTDDCNDDIEILTLSWSEASNLIALLLEALTHLHRLGIAHGDLYGHNILIQQDNHFQVKLSDFGAAFRYPTQSEYGRRIQAIELRAMAVLVQEVATHLLTPREDDKVNKLNDLAEQCLQEHATFDRVHVWWQQQRLSDMATAFGVDE